MTIEDMTLDELNELKDRLLEKRQVLKNKAKEVYEYWDKIEEEFFKSEKTEDDEKIFNSEKEKIHKKLDEIDEEIYELGLNKVEEEIYFKKPPATTNNVIDLRKGGYFFSPPNENSVIGTYDIFLHNTKIWVGSIDYRGYHCERLDRDVGYKIEEEYRGKGYGFQALTLLSDILYRKGISDFWITVEKNNIASIKTIERYGGKIIAQYKSGLLDYGSVLDFECKTRQIEFENENNIQK